MYVRNDSDVKSVRDLKGLRIPGRFNAQPAIGGQRSDVPSEQWKVRRDGSPSNHGVVDRAADDPAGPNPASETLRFPSTHIDHGADCIHQSRRVLDSDTSVDRQSSEDGDGLPPGVSGNSGVMVEERRSAGFVLGLVRQDRWQNHARVGRCTRVIA